MKTAFKILPVNEEAKADRLLIEQGCESISFVYFSEHPFRVNALYIYHFEKNIAPADMAAELSTFFKDEQLPGFTESYICYNFRECTLVPQSLFKENMLPQIVQCIFPSNDHTVYYAGEVKQLDAIAAYSIDERIEKVLAHNFSSIKKQHSLQLQLPQLQKKENLFYCIVYQNSIKVILIKEHVLQFAGFFNYSTPSDVAYHLLNVCTQHGLLPELAVLTLSGFIDKKSNLYEELYRYFLNIELQENEDETETSAAIKQYPSHFFSHLISLAQCVS